MTGVKSLEENATVQNNSPVEEEKAVTPPKKKKVYIKKIIHRKPAAV